MKRLVLAIAVILVIVALAAAGCAGEELPAVDEGELVASSCVTCHTDKDTLKEVATPEPEEATSEESSGEG
jgi:cytochrome c553